MNTRALNGLRHAIKGEECLIRCSAVIGSDYVTTTSTIYIRQLRRNRTGVYHCSRRDYKPPANYLHYNRRPGASFPSFSLFWAEFTRRRRRRSKG